MENQKMLPRVNVLISTYNGHQYLEHQLDTLAAQTNVSLTITVRDDGSTDDTLEILKRYKQNVPINIIKGSNLGFARSFWTLLKDAEDCEFFAFCDQDDDWLPNKLEAAINEINKIDKDIPTLYTSNAYAVNENLEHIKDKAFDFEGILTEAKTLKTSVLPGCTFVFNKALREIARKYNGPIISHDWMLYEIATFLGTVVYDNNIYINYRIHKTNTIGIDNSFKLLKRRIGHLFKPLSPSRSEVAAAMLDTYMDELSSDQCELLKLFENANDIRYGHKLLHYKEFRDPFFIVMMMLHNI